MKDKRIKYTEIGNQIIIMEMKDWRKIKKALKEKGVDIIEDKLKARWKLAKEQPM